MKDRKVIVVDLEIFHEILNQGLPHKNITKELWKIIECLGSGYCDSIGASGAAEELEKLIS